MTPKTFSHVPRSDWNESILKTGMTFESFGQVADCMIEPERGFYEKAIQSYPGRILFLSGEKDSLTRTAEEKFLNAAPKGQLHIIKSGTHIISLEPNSRDEMNQVVLDFASEVDWENH